MGGAYGKFYDILSEAFGIGRSQDTIALLKERLEIEQLYSSYWARWGMTILASVQVVLALSVVILTLYLLGWIY